MTQEIIHAAEVIGAVVVIVGAVCKIYVPIKNLIGKIEILEKHQKETYMQTLRLVICSKEIPLDERIKAGDIYIKEGGNGAVKHLYHDLLDSLPPES